MAWQEQSRNLTFHGLQFYKKKVFVSRIRQEKTKMYKVKLNTNNTAKLYLIIPHISFFHGKCGKDAVVTFQHVPILTLRSLTLYIYGAPILDVSRSHTTTQHSR